MQENESAYIARLDSASQYKFLPSGTATVRAVTKDPDAHKTDETAIATYSGGELHGGAARALDGPVPAADAGAAGRGTRQPDPGVRAERGSERDGGPPG